MEHEFCPCCGGDSSELGTLGNLTHFRCRACGAQWSVPVHTDDTDLVDIMSASEYCDELDMSRW